jgi:hypothetical protein
VEIFLGTLFQHLLLKCVCVFGGRGVCVGCVCVPRSGRVYCKRIVRRRSLQNRISWINVSRKHTTCNTKLHAQFLRVTCLCTPPLMLICLRHRNLFLTSKNNNNNNTNPNLYHCIQAYRGMEVNFHTLNSALNWDGLLYIVSLCDGGKHFSSCANPKDGGNTLLGNDGKSLPSKT